MIRTKRSAKSSTRILLSMDVTAKRDALFSQPYPNKPTVAQVLEYTGVMFESEQAAFRWLTTHCPALDKTPAESMNAPKGRGHVLDVLFGAYHGIYQ